MSYDEGATMSRICCAHPVYQHTRHGCSVAYCVCAVRWDEHPDRYLDVSADEMAEAMEQRRRGMMPGAPLTVSPR